MHLFLLCLCIDLYYAIIIYIYIWMGVQGVVVPPPAMLWVPGPRGPPLRCYAPPPPYQCYGSGFAGLGGTTATITNTTTHTHHQQMSTTP